MASKRTAKNKKRVRQTNLLVKEILEMRTLTNVVNQWFFDWGGGNSQGDVRYQQKIVASLFRLHRIRKKMRETAEKK